MSSRPNTILRCHAVAQCRPWLAQSSGAGAMGAEVAVAVPCRGFKVPRSLGLVMCWLCVVVRYHAEPTIQPNHAMPSAQLRIRLSLETLHLQEMRVLWEHSQLTFLLPSRKMYPKVPGPERQRRLTTQQPQLRTQFSTTCYRAITRTPNLSHSLGLRKL